MTSPIRLPGEIFTRHVSGSVLVRKGRGDTTPPSPPGALTATPGDSQISLSWIASPTAGVTYMVKRVNLNASVWTGSGLSTVVTGLSNDVTYNFQVYAIDSAGRVSAPSNIATAVPAATGQPVGVSTYFGYNFNNTDTSFQTVAGRKAQFNNRCPMLRSYGGTLSPGDTFGVSSTVATEKRVCYSYKEGTGVGTGSKPGYTAASLADGTAQTAMRSWLTSIPSGWVVFWVFHHEPNSSSGMEVDPTTFRGVFAQMMIAYNAVKATLAANNVKVFITCNFMAFSLDVIWTNRTSWIPSPANCHVLTWDIYGNPGVNTATSGSNKYGGPATGKRYDTTYPLADIRTDMVWKITEDMGYADSWGVLELNSPLRNWDTTESGRAQWTQDMLNIMVAPPMTGAVPAKICLMWEAPSGVNWDQAFGDNVSADSPGGTLHAYANRALSPVWNVWYPYITGVPVG